MKFGIVVFPGSNCDRDCYDAVAQYLKEEAVYLWHEDRDLKGVDGIIIPGGFSYGDYLRAGAIAQCSPIMESIKGFAAQGRPVLGICNGFQVLTESHLLPGCLIKNTSLQFQCEQVELQVENNQTLFTKAYTPGQKITISIAHGEGNFFAAPEVIDELESKGQVVFRYTQDVNGSINRIAGISNEQGNVLGMMPHPERNLWQSETWSGEGAPLFKSLQASLTAMMAV